MSHLALVRLAAPLRSTLLAMALLSGPLTGAALAAKDTIVIDLVNEPSSLDPQVQWNPDSYDVYRNIFDNLLTRNAKGEIVPQIATSWRYLSETEIEFTLRTDVTFHDGHKLTPEDVVFSIKRITDPAFASPQLGQFNKIRQAEATGPDRVKLTTDGAYPVLLAQLVKLSIVPKHVVEAVGKEQFNLHPVGSGPYRLETWQRGVKVVLARNDAYWGDKGAFVRAEFRAVPDAATRLADLQTGTSDLVVTLDSDLASQLKGSAVAEPRVVLSERVAYLKINPQRPPLDDVRVRRAIALAIDKEGLVQGILGGYDRPVGELLTPVHVGWVEGIEVLPYDPAAARKLIAEVGPAAKARLSFATSPAFDQRVVQALQQMLADVGLNPEIELTDMATYLKRVQSEPSAQPFLGFGRWSCACQDADGVLFPLLHASSSWSTLRNPAIDAKLEEARGTLDVQKRLAAYKAVHDFMASEVPIVPLYQSAIIYGASRKLVWQPTPDESMFLNRMSWKD